MKRMWMVGALALLVGAVAATPAGAASDNFFAAGGGTTSPFAGQGNTTHFAFSAHCKAPSGVCLPAGTAPSGHAVLRSPALGEAQGHVCAYQDFSIIDPPIFLGIAAFWIKVEKGSGFFGSFPALQVVARDFSPDADEVTVDGTFSCDFGGPNTPFGGPIVTKGNVVVK
jgi:hypothetical protein